MMKWALTLALVAAPVAAVAGEGATPSTPLPQQSVRAHDVQRTDAQRANANDVDKTPPPPLAEPVHEPTLAPKVAPSHAGKNSLTQPER